MPTSSLNRPMKVAVLCSGRAPGLLHVLNRDARRGTDYRIVCCITSHETFAEEVRVERRGIPCIPHSIVEFCHAHGAAFTDLEARSEYDRATVELLEAYRPDILLLDRYLLVLTAPLLRAYAGRIINIHPADVLQRNADGSVKYPGIHAVRNAILGGETETRASAHIVTSKLDDGPVLLRSWSFAVPPVARWALAHEASDVLRASAWAHQEWMLREAWGAMMARAIEVAGLAFERPDAPLNLTLAGRWALAPDGTFTPDGALLETR